MAQKHAKKSTAKLRIVPEPLQDRKKQTDEESDLLPPCKCQRVCAERISEEDRNQIRINFLSKSYGERRIWLLQNIQSMGVKRRRSDSLGRNEDNQFRKKTSRTYTLGTAKVCKGMLMLGYKSD